MSQQDNFDTQMKWMIYGANGYTGELIARDAVKRGLKPVLAGRSQDKVEALARELGLEARVFGLEDEVRLPAQIKGHGLVLHCAGPFSATAVPMMEACLRANAHYLDITGEIAVFEHAQSLSERARAAGVVICPGVGFDVVPTDCVAEEVVQSGVDMVGIGTALAIDPHLPRDWLLGKDNAPKLRPITWKNKAIASLANMAVVKFQLRKLSRAKKPDPNVSPLRALILQQLGTACRTRQYRRWAEKRLM